MRSTGFQPVHPRKLYAQLLASESLEERAQATLDFLCGCTGAAGGCLFLVRDQGLSPAANSHQSAPSAELLAEAERTWTRELEAEPEINRTRTVDVVARTQPEALLKDMWTSASGVAYVRHVLGTYQGTRWTPVGIALLEAGSRFAPLRHAYVEVMCNAFIAAGDVPGSAG
ncbi:MAG TPA: hypothetical protein VFN67_38890 [Polyangiales bacterium]|nr:hypothetical protein [Polyangiales bacterium]